MGCLLAGARQGPQIRPVVRDARHLPTLCPLYRRTPTLCNVDTGPPFRSLDPSTSSGAFVCRCRFGDARLEKTPSWPTGAWVDAYLAPFPAPWLPMTLGGQMTRKLRRGDANDESHGHPQNNYWAPITTNKQWHKASSSPQAHHRLTYPRPRGGAGVLLKEVLRVVRNEGFFSPSRPL